MREFLSYLEKNKPDIEPIIFTASESIYADRLMKFVDPTRKVFQDVFYRNACYLFEHKEEDITIFVKDIARFKNRDIRRSVLIDSKHLSFMMTPENAMPVLPYKADYDGMKDFNQKDNYLLTLIEDIEKLKELDDVRPYLDETFQIKQKLKSAKLI